MEETVIKINYDTDEAQKSIDELALKIDGLTESNKVYQKMVKDARSDLKKTDDQLKEEGKTRDNLINTIQKGTVALSRNKDEIAKARKERGENIRLVNGEKTAFEKLTEAVKEGTDESKKHTQMLGGLQKGFGNLQNSMKNIPGPMGGIVNGFMGMTKAALAFIATPIGAIIAALGLALKALISYFKGSEEGQNRLNKMSMVFSTIMGNLSDIVQKVGKWIFEAVTKPKEAIKELGEFIQQNLINRFLAFGEIGKAIVKIFSKDWAEGFKDLANASIQLATGFTDVLDKAAAAGKALLAENKREMDIAKNLADRQAALDLLQRKFLVEKEKLEAKIAEARVKAVDKENYSAEERVKLLKEAIDIEMQILDTDQKITKEKFELKRIQNSLSNSTKDDLNEQAQLEADMYRTQRENAQKRMALTAQLNAAQKELNAEQKKTGEGSEETNQLDEKAQAEILKRRGQAIAKLAELKQMELESEAKNIKDKMDLQVKAADDELTAKLEQQGILHEEIELAEQEHKMRLAEIERQYQEEISMQRQTALDGAFASMQEIINATAGMAGERVTIMSDAFSKIATINFKEIKSAKDAFITIGSAAKGLTSLIVAGHQAQLNDLQAQKQAELQYAGDNVAAKEAIEAKYNKKLVALKKQQFKEEKAKSLVDGAIATALGVAKALGSSPPPVNFIMAGVVGVLGGIQMAAIARQKEPTFTSDQVFARGGGIVSGASHKQGGVNVFGDNGQFFGNVEGGEAMFVMKKDATAEIAAYSRINESYGGRSFNSAPVKTAQDGGQLSGNDIAGMVDREIARTPIYVKVGDIETGLTEVNNVRNAGVI